MDLRFKQISVGQYSTQQGRQSFVVIGLTDEGKVYQFKGGQWRPIEEAFSAASASASSNLKSFPKGKKTDESDGDELPW